tara:strand:- start:952 stop:1137 length:186 start_codon:yes stop_codon:yes gene_type:complete
MVFPKENFPVDYPDGLKKGITVTESPIFVIKVKCILRKKVSVKINHKKSLEKSRPKIRFIP